MPTSVADVMSAGGVSPQGVVRWGAPVPVPHRGVYVVALTDDPEGIAGTMSAAPISRDAVATLLERRPELCIDGRRPTLDELRARLAANWLPDEAILYVGLAGTSLQSRVGQYYSTSLGARSPHAGGWFVKTLTVLDDVWVHYARCGDPATVEAQMLAAFVAAVRARTSARLHDDERPMPFANLEWPKRRRKQHGITGATAPSSTPVVADAADRPAAATARATRRRFAATGACPGGAPAGDLPSQTLTDKDLEAGIVRFPRAAKLAFPRDRAHVDIELRGRLLKGRWDPGMARRANGLVSSSSDPGFEILVQVGDRLTVHPGQPTALT